MNKLHRYAREMFMVLVMIQAGLLSGCGGDDGDSPSTTTTVVTNVVNGVTQTNVVVVTNEPAADEVVSEETTGPETFGGGYCGHYENENGSSYVSSSLDNDAGEISGRFSLSGGDRGSITGTLEGFHLDMTLTVENGGKWIRMVCTVIESGYAFSGTWTDSLGNAGTCEMERCK